MKSYNLNISQNRAVRTDSDCHGWCYGLPPGISSAQWPLDPANGYPLQHGFTLLLPEEYRCHGPDFVAFSFFASSIDHNDGGPTVKAPGIRPAMGGAEAPDNPELKLFWEAEQRAHPHLSRMEDSLGIAYAVIMLIRAEFDGPFCAPPILVANRYRDALKPPAWLTIGGVRVIGSSVLLAGGCGTSSARNPRTIQLKIARSIGRRGPVIRMPAAFLTMNFYTTRPITFIQCVRSLRRTARPYSMIPNGYVGMSRIISAARCARPSG